MANFDPAYIKTVEENEGGYVLHEIPGDRGGLTFAGITQRSFTDDKIWDHIDPKWINAMSIQCGDDPFIHNLVRDFYKRNFWDRIKGDEIDSQEIAESLFDFAVNVGVRTAVRGLQRLINKTTMNNLILDGVMGTKTIQGLEDAVYDNEWYGLDTINILNRSYFFYKFDFYDRLCLYDSTQKQFFRGWVKRARKYVGV